MGDDSKKKKENLFSAMCARWLLPAGDLCSVKEREAIPNTGRYQEGLSLSICGAGYTDHKINFG